MNFNTNPKSFSDPLNNRLNNYYANYYTADRFSVQYYLISYLAALYLANRSTGYFTGL